MESTRLVVFAFMLCINNTVLCQENNWAKTSKLGYFPTKNKVTNLHFYFHDTVNGKDPTAVLVAKPNISPTSSFGSVYAVDDPLTVGPALSSQIIGNAQGMYVFSGIDVPTLVVSLDLGFTEGEFKGSSISVFSRNTILDTERELAVVGGRGVFRMAEGFAKLKTYYIDPENGDAIIEYNVTILHTSNDFSY